MTLGTGSRGQLHIYVRPYICAYTKYHEAILHHIGPYILRAKHVTSKVRGGILIT